MFVLINLDRLFGFSGHVATFKHADVGLAGLFIGLGEIAGKGMKMSQPG